MMAVFMLAYLRAVQFRTSAFSLRKQFSFLHRRLRFTGHFRRPRCYQHATCRYNAVLRHDIRCRGRRAPAADFQHALTAASVPTSPSAGRRALIFDVGHHARFIAAADAHTEEQRSTVKNTAANITARHAGDFLPILTGAAADVEQYPPCHVRPQFILHVWRVRDTTPEFILRLRRRFGSDVVSALCRRRAGADDKNGGGQRSRSSDVLNGLGAQGVNYRERRKMRYLRCHDVDAYAARIPFRRLIYFSSDRYNNGNQAV